MTIRNIITSAAMVAVLGLAGGSAYANDSDSHIDDQGFTVSADANYPGNAFVYNGDSDVNEGNAETFGRERAVLPKHLWCTIHSSYSCKVKSSS